MYTPDERLPYENLDRLVTTEMRPWNMLQGYVRPLYEYVRGENPITYEITQALSQHNNAKVAIVTGIVFEHLPHGEIDGPIGSVVLARALERLGHRVDIFVEREMEGVIRRLTNRLGISPGLVITSDRSTEDALAWAKEYDIAITVEKLGRNAKGIRHSIMGSPLPPGDSYIDDFIQAMTNAGKLTIGMGDGGNEIGFGKIYEKARALVPRGMDCECECHGGLVTVTATKYLFPAAVSNFGAYAITAGLALHYKDLDLLVTGDTVEQLIRDAVAEGCLDGGTVDPQFIGDDGIPVEFVKAVVTVLRGIVSQWQSTFDRHF